MEYEVSAEDVARMLEEALPAGSAHAELHAVGAQLRGDDIIAVLRLFVWDVDAATGERAVRDIKEQEVYFVPASCRDDRARVGAYVRAWAAVLREVLEAVGTSVVEVRMPHDFVFARALNLARAETEDDFKKALRVKSRLGGLLAAAGAP